MYKINKNKDDRQRLWILVYNHKFDSKKKSISNKKVKCFTDFYLVEELIEDFFRYSKDFNIKSNCFNPQMPVLQFSGSEMVFRSFELSCWSGVGIRDRVPGIPRSLSQKSGTETGTHN